MRVAVCDDVPLHANLVIALLDMYKEERPGVKLWASSFNSAEKLLEDINAGQSYDIYLLDIIMPDTDGITLAQKIRLHNENVPVVFITQSSGHALDAFGVFAAQYIVKPIKKETFFSVLDKIIAMKNIESDSFITVTTIGCITTIFHSSIVVVENSRRTLRFYLDTGEIVNSKVIRTSFAVALEGLLKDRRFLWVHQSYVVNMAHVKELRRHAFVMKNGMEVSIPRPKYSSIKLQYLKFANDSI